MPMIWSRLSWYLAFLHLSSWPLIAQYPQTPPDLTGIENLKPVKEPDTRKEWEIQLPGYREKLQPLVDAWASGAWGELETVATNVEELPLVRLFAVHPLFEKEINNNKLIKLNKKQNHQYYKMISEIAPTVVGLERTCLMQIWVGRSKDREYYRIDGSNIWGNIDEFIVKKDGNPELLKWLWQDKLYDSKKYRHPTSWYLIYPIVILKNWNYFSEITDPIYGFTRIDEGLQDSNISRVKELKSILKDYARVFGHEKKKLLIVKKAFNRKIKIIQDEDNMKSINL